MPAIFALLLVCSCGADNGTPLVAALFRDEIIPDGQPQAGESILLTFDAPVRLDAPAKVGVETLPEAHSLGLYELLPGPLPHQLVVKLGRGDPPLVARGTHGESGVPVATGLRLDFSKIEKLFDHKGRPLTGLSSVVDVETAIRLPARLEHATWQDQDRSFSVSDGDRLRLDFTRAVTLAQEIRPESHLPLHLFFLPVEGDRFDDGRHPARLAQNPDRTIELILGSAPRLTSLGVYRHANNHAGAATGICVNGSDIRPQPYIIDEFEVGVASDTILDLEGDCKPFRDAPDLPIDGVLFDHTATALPDGRVLVTGGALTTPGRRGLRVLDSAWIFDPAKDEWIAAGNLKHPRYQHSATWFPGVDGIPETADDFVLVFGGWDGKKSLNTVELLLPFAADAEFIPVTEVVRQPPSPRFLHTAHSLPGTNRLAVVGGLSGDQVLSARVEELEISFRQDGDEIVPRLECRYGPKLLFPRAFHDSLLVQDESGPALFLFGGYGRDSASAVNELLIFSERVCRILDEPEFIALGGEHSERLPPADNSRIPPARRGHRLVQLAEEEFPLLLVGGTALSPFLEGMPATESACRTAQRLEIDTSTAPPTLRVLECGALPGERHSFETAVLPNGTVLIAGGWIDGVASSTVELFRPECNDFESICAPLDDPRESFQLVPLADDRWLFIGGLGPERKASCEFFQFEN